MLNVLHHPAFQSLLLPGLLALLAMAVLRIVGGARWMPLGAVLGLLGALAWLPGFEWPATSRVQKLPWTVLAGLVVAAVAMAQQRAGRSWGMRAVWMTVCTATVAWLAGAQGSVPLVAAGAAAGGVVLGLLAWPAPAASDAGARTDAATRAATLAVAALGLAALAGGGGSLLLAQLALMLATCCAVLGAWLWWRPGPGRHEAVLLPLGLAWLALAASWALSASAVPAVAVTGADAARLALLVLAFAVPHLLLRRRRTQARARWAPLIAALLAAVPVAAAVGWQLAAPAAQTPGTPDDDPYYTPA